MQSLITCSSRQEIIYFPQSTTIFLNNLDHLFVNVIVKGPLGESFVSIPNTIHVQIDNENRTVILSSFSQIDHPLCSTFAQKLRHLVSDFEKLFTVFLEVRGLGYRMRMDNGLVEFFVGRSHTKFFTPPNGVDIKLLGSKGRVLQLSSNNRELLTQVFAILKKYRQPGVYSERGVYTKYEVAKCKTGKKKKFG